MERPGEDLERLNFAGPPRRAGASSGPGLLDASVCCVFSSCCGSGHIDFPAFSFISAASPQQRWDPCGGESS